MTSAKNQQSPEHISASAKEYCILPLFGRRSILLWSSTGDSSLQMLYSAANCLGTYMGCRYCTRTWSRIWDGLAVITHLLALYYTGMELEVMHIVRIWYHTQPRQKIRHKTCHKANS